MGGPSRHSATRSRMPCFISLNGSSEVSRTNFCTPSTPSISPSRIEDVGDAVRVEHDAVAGIEFHIERGFPIHRFRQRAEHHAARFEQARLFPGVDDHCRRVPGAGKHHAASVAVDPRGRQGEKENRAADVLHHEAIELAQHDPRAAPLRSCVIVSV